ncbi:CoA-acylating methylmalonate-semialdehyde dehydrogenase [Alcaligenes faecalis]|uniref:methylmalonate-semialdehyde dehydrogenase (CoA acylating) n=2 Tax=Alcaligenes faecalis TaxID=511 RepID=A0A2U2BN78_ALCFA|nr:CoA-acylating methylmalonate-semialdehyde dehydrogenase [Alcaligenes faecalis]MBW4787884.1 CoA-acylating methylmalonate-semialdehyde dehydrogenase [Alcaligenes faecalis subsp. faecalis]MBY6316835.1 CoA-acylating methylmalonate-semialdehyde dehydrogenase [Alcaligenes faecalis]MBY6389958.1 CoA-acylating methylmalonate-semialdehyde dehydrogenase [Alcaligenes faecalis]OSZ40800.1 methylmalonate-semialdehyde dehydrogenase (acylating) [Alcaligenes faecalis]OSZ49753.1 methylmalonate-semialdehyde de
MTEVVRVPLLIDGQHVQSKSTRWDDVLNPATQEVVAQVPYATMEELETIIASSAKAYESWRHSSQGARMRVMLNLQRLVRENSAKLAEAISREHGKTMPDAEGEVGRGLEVIEYACSIASMQLGEYAENAAGGIDVYTLIQPLGVCAGVTAFNFPVMLPCFMFPLAVACGNTFVLKPSEQDPSASLMLAELALEAGLPPGVLNVVHGGADIANALVTHPEVKAVSFIGSTAVGTEIHRRATEAGKRSQAMMGAKNHCIVMPDADRDVAINQLLGAAFGAAGQRCMAISVAVMVGESGEWVDELVKRAATMKVNVGTDRQADLGPLVSPRARQRVESLIEAGVQEGASLLLDGRGVKVPGYESGNFVGPTIFNNVKADMRIYEEEIFGPVLCIVRVNTLEEAVQFINRNPNGNGVSIFTQDGGHARYFQNRIDVGQIGINIPIPVPVAWFSFTGSRASKLGDLGPNGKQAVQFWTQTKTVTARWQAHANTMNTTISMT